MQHMSTSSISTFVAHAAATAALAAAVFTAVAAANPHATVSANGYDTSPGAIQPTTTSTTGGAG